MYKFSYDVGEKIVVALAAGEIKQLFTHLVKLIGG